MRERLVCGWVRTDRDRRPKEHLTTTEEDNDIITEVLPVLTTLLIHLINLDVFDGSPDTPKDFFCPPFLGEKATKRLLICLYDKVWKPRIVTTDLEGLVSLLRDCTNLPFSRDVRDSLCEGSSIFKT